MTPPEVNTKQAERAAVEVVDSPHVSQNGLSGPLPKRKNFPFLRDSTRREMDERAHRAQFGKQAVGDLPARKEDRTCLGTNTPQKVEREQARR